MLFECQYSCFSPLQDFFDTLNYLISVTNEGIKRKIWLSTTLWSTSSWRSVSWSTWHLKNVVEPPEPYSSTFMSGVRREQTSFTLSGSSITVLEHRVKDVFIIVSLSLMAKCHKTTLKTCSLVLKAKLTDS